MRQNKLILNHLSCILLVVLLLPETLYSQNGSSSIKVDGSVKYQTIDGFGVNINPAWWFKGEYGNASVIKPAIDMLIDSLGATIFRVVIEELDWETVNDDADPAHFNWDYFNKVFSGKRFRGTWDALKYLNSRGITGNLMISFMGAPPSPAPLSPDDQTKSWMGETIYGISPAGEDEFVESLAAFLWYMKNTEKISFGLVSPMNETDIVSWSKNAEHPNGLVEGPDIPDPVQYVRVVRKLAKKLDSEGMGDIRLVMPDAAGDKLFRGVFDETVRDPYLMSKLASWGVHQYGDDAANYRNIVTAPANTNKSFWVTETAGIANMLGQLDDDARAYIFWDGFDCVYQHGRRNVYGDMPPNDWAFWMTPENGKPLIEYDQADGSWKPRKQFYQHEQIMKFIRPGATRIGVAVTDTSIMANAFINAGGTLVIVGRNKAAFNVNTDLLIPDIKAGEKIETFFTDSGHDFARSSDLNPIGDKCSVTIPGDCIFTFVAGSMERVSSVSGPEPDGWYAGDIHVHRNCGEVTPVTQESDLPLMMETNNLSVISLLADMGNGEVQDSKADLPKVNGSDAPCSKPGRIVHWDAEWHFDPAGVTFENKALGGHIVLLGLREAHRIWDESPYKILAWARDQQAVTGFCHMEYLDDKIPGELTCCIPIDYPVEAALGTIDFLSEDVWLNDAGVNGYYKILNCGFRLGWTAGTDFPCNGSKPLGSLLTYVRIKDKPLTYSGWIDGIKKGRTVVCTDSHTEFIDLKINGDAGPGDVIQSDRPVKICADAVWSTSIEKKGRIEIVCNGKVVGSLEGSAEPGHPLHYSTNLEIPESSWVCARRMDENGHRSHTSPVYVTVKHKPVRASAEDARFFIAWIDNILARIEPGGTWNSYFQNDLSTVRNRYLKARAVYEKIADESTINRKK